MPNSGKIQEIGSSRSDGPNFTFVIYCGTQVASKQPKYVKCSLNMAKVGQDDIICALVAIYA